MSVAARADRGSLALVLHSHMPYVEGFGTWPSGEEWIWEALGTSYVPLLDVLEDAAVTVSLTPVLCDQLEALPGEPGRRMDAWTDTFRVGAYRLDRADLERAGEPELRGLLDAERARSLLGEQVLEARLIRALG